MINAKMDDLEDICEEQPEDHATTQLPPQGKTKLSRLHRMNVTRPGDQPTGPQPRGSVPSVAAVIQNLQAKDLKDLGPEDDHPTSSDPCNGTSGPKSKAMDVAAPAPAAQAAGPLSTHKAAACELQAEPSTSQPAGTRSKAAESSPLEDRNTAGAAEVSSSGAQGMVEPDPADPLEEAAKGSIDAYLAEHGLAADDTTKPDESLHDSDLEVNSDSEGAEEQQHKQQQPAHMDQDEGNSRGSGYWDEEDELEDMLNKENDGEQYPWDKGPACVIVAS